MKGLANETNRKQKRAFYSPQISKYELHYKYKEKSNEIQINL